MSRPMAADSQPSRKFLPLALLVLLVNTSSCLVSSSSADAVIRHPGSDQSSSSDESRTWHSVSDGRLNSTAKDVSDAGSREGRFFFPDPTSRTLFGARRRIQFALLPIMYKLGVISTMLVGITVMVLKGLTIGVILLFFALGNSLAKLKHHQPPQPVHFHLHPGDHHPKSHVYHSYEPSGPWDKASDDSDAAYENYDPGVHRRLPLRYPYRYSNRDYYPYHGR